MPLFYPLNLKFQQVVRYLQRPCFIYYMILFIRSVVVVVFFTLTDRASSIPSNIRGCQSVVGYLNGRTLKQQNTDVWQCRSSKIYGICLWRTALQTPGRTLRRGVG